jgi:four helix bundle protein
MVVKRFEDLWVWQESARFAQEIGVLIRLAPFKEDHALRNQLNGAALSIMSNIAEGFLRRRGKEFSHFLRIAAGSNAEARSLLYAAQARGHLPREECARLVEMTNQIGRMLRSLERRVEHY